MKNNSLNSKLNLTKLVNELTIMSQNVKVDSVEETAFTQIISRFHQDDNIEQAIAGFEEAIYKNRLTIAFMKKKISQLIENKIADLAIETISLATQLAPHDRELHFLMIQACRLNEDYSRALDILDTLKADAAPREVILILNEEAAIYKLMQNAESTFVSLRRLLTIDPHNEDALREIWWSIEMSKNYKESLKLHKIVIEKNPYSARAWYNLAHAEYYLHQYENAIRSFEYAYIIDPKFELAYRYCAEVCTLTGRFEQALKCYYDLMEHAVADAEALKSIGVIEGSAQRENGQRQIKTFRQGECDHAGGKPGYTPQQFLSGIAQRRMLGHVQRHDHRAGKWRRTQESESFLPHPEHFTGKDR